MTWVDGVIILGAVIGAVVGYRQGLVVSAFGLLGFIVGLALAGFVSDLLAKEVSSSTASWLGIVSFVLILVVVLVVFDVVGQAVKKSIKTIMLSMADSIGGALIGVFTGGLMTAAIFIAIGTWAGGDTGETSVGRAIGDSALAHFFIDTFRFLLALLPGRFDAARDLFN